VKAVLTTKVRPAYDDKPDQQYHFPRTYLRQVQAAIGDQVLYYEPRRSDADVRSRGGRQAYFAAAKIAGVRPDQNRADHFYADITDYVPFPYAVPFAKEGHYFETMLRKVDGSTNKGAAGRAVRNIPDSEFELIVAAGMAPVLGELRAETSQDWPGLQEEPAEFERPIVQQLLNRKVRDAMFARVVRDAYDSTCAVTGLRIINGGGKAEIEVAHIQPVERNGPDFPRNGIALCRTVHWMFDRGLIGLTSDGRFDVNTRRVPEEARRMFRQDGRLIAPRKAEHQPSERFVEWHRREIYLPKLEMTC
jgi:putative restriction endonuclease